MATSGSTSGLMPVKFYTFKVQNQDGGAGYVGHYPKTYLAVVDGSNDYVEGVIPIQQLDGPHYSGPLHVSRLAKGDAVQINGKPETLVNEPKQLNIMA